MEKTRATLRSDCVEDEGNNTTGIIKGKDRMAADWRNLNQDMLQAIGEKLDLYADYLRFRSVSVEWSSSLSNKPRRLQQQQCPYLLFPAEYSDLEEEENNTNWLPHRPLLNPLDGNVVDHIELPKVARGRGDKLHFIGFSKGWLIAFENDGIDIHLFNIFPAVDHHRLLPPITTLPDLNRIGNGFLPFRQKVVLSSPPTGSDCIAMGIYGEGADLAYCRYGDERWVSVGGKILESGSGYADIISYKDKFYAIDSEGALVQIVLSNMDFVAIDIIIDIPPLVLSNLYLAVVESSQKEKEKYDYLVFVGREEETMNFEILCKVNLTSNEQVDWFSHSTILEDCVLFLGYNESLCFPSCHSSGPKGEGRIYFSDHLFEAYHEKPMARSSDIGVCKFNYKFMNCTLHPLPGYQHRQLMCPPPIWVMRHNPC